MYVVASDNRRISLVISCFDCFTCDTTEEDEFKNRQKAQKFSRELLLAGCIKYNKLTFMSFSPISMRKYVRRRFQ